MMAGIYAVQGSWYPLLAVHLDDLGVGGRMRGAIFGSLALTSLVSPVVLAGVADRAVSIQKLMAAVYGLGAVVLAIIGSGLPSTGPTLLAAFLVYWFIMAPGLGLGSALALRNLPDPARQFSLARMWGTIGWMAIGWVVSALMIGRGTATAGRGAHDAFLFAAALSTLVSLYCLTLPDTPPLRRPVEGPSTPKRWDLSAWGQLLRGPSVGPFLAIAFGIGLATPFVYQVVPTYLELRGLPRAWVAAAMSLGQALEIVALFVLPRVWAAVGDRGTLLIGAGALDGVLPLLVPRPAVLGHDGNPLAPGDRNRVLPDRRPDVPRSPRPARPPGERPRALHRRHHRSRRLARQRHRGRGRRTARERIEDVPRRAGNRSPAVPRPPLGLAIAPEATGGCGTRPTRVTRVEPIRTSTLASLHPQTHQPFRKIDLNSGRPVPDSRDGSPVSPTVRTPGGSDAAGFQELGDSPWKAHTGE